MNAAEKKVKAKELSAEVKELNREIKGAISDRNKLNKYIDRTGAKVEKLTERIGKLQPPIEHE